jgi:hypothetical protein
MSFLTRPLGRPIGPLGKPIGLLGRPIGPLGKPIGHLGKPIGRLGKPIGHLGKPIGRLGKPICPPSVLGCHIHARADLRPKSRLPRCVSKKVIKNKDLCPREDN